MFGAPLDALIHGGPLDPPLAPSVCSLRQEKGEKLGYVAVASGRQSLVVPDYQREYPRSIYFNDIVHDARDWRNACYAAYFGLQRIRREHGSAE